MSLRTAAFGILVIVILLLGAKGVEQVLRSGDEQMSLQATTGHGEYLDDLQAGTCGADDGHAHGEGQLTAQRNSRGKVTGWTCWFNSHAVCTAGPDGVWKECTFRPSLMPWPNNVSQQVLHSPPHTGHPLP